MKTVEARPGPEELQSFHGSMPQVQGGEVGGVFRAVEKMVGGVICLPTARAGRGGREVNAVPEVVQSRAIPRPQLGQGCSRYSGKVSLGVINVRCCC